MANGVHRTYKEDVRRRSKNESVYVFRQPYDEKPVVFWGRLAWMVQQLGEKLNRLSQCLAEVIFENGIPRIYLGKRTTYLRGSLEGIRHCQVPFALREKLG